MQLKIKLGQLFNKNNFVVFVSTILFIGCATFVAFRGYKCFEKYFMEPEHSEISYKPSKNHPFPSFTFCASEKLIWTFIVLAIYNFVFSSKFLFGNKTNHFSLADSLPASENREIKTLYQKTNSSQGRLARAYIYPIQQKSFWTNEDTCLN